MNQNNIFGEGIFFRITNLIYALLMTNLFFVLTNLIALFFFMTLEPTFSNVTIYFLALIPTGPAISALIYSIGKLIREKELSPLQDFFHGYKINFKDTMKFWLPLLLVVYILIVDLQYFNSNPSTISSILSVIFMIGILLTIVIAMNGFLIIAGYKFRFKDIWKLAVYYSFTKVKITFGNISIVIITLFLLSITSHFLLLFIGSIICYLFLLNSKGLFEDIQMNFCEPKENLS